MSMDQIWRISFVALFVLSLLEFASSLSLNRQRKPIHIHNEKGRIQTISRREILKYVPSSMLVLSQVKPAYSAMQSSQQVFTAGKDLTEDEAVSRFKEGQKSLQYLLDNYDDVCKGGGDNVRRYLGTVGTTSGLWGISKVMKALQDRADDIVEFTETMGEVEASLRGADSAA